ncbi:hypothetical protein AURDEDRAFT_147670 [Auricularia subglabra TFB-10046 SS5]|nr:hypothetical protein AURDEDRAFT_147670 [Auricularia subglabra TFB-10046 SS5]
MHIRKPRLRCCRPGRVKDSPSTTMLSFSLVALLLVLRVAAAEQSSLFPANGGLALNGLFPDSEPGVEAKRRAVSGEKPNHDDPSCLGVTLCTGQDLTGDCFWGCYPERVMMYVSDDWRLRLESARLELPGSWCEFYGGTVCYPDLEYPSQYVRYPGGNFGSDIVDDMGCFTCALKPLVVP